MVRFQITIYIVASILRFRHDVSCSKTFLFCERSFLIQIVGVLEPGWQVLRSRVLEKIYCERNPSDFLNNLIQVLSRYATLYLNNEKRNLNIPFTQ